MVILAISLSALHLTEIHRQAALLLKPLVVVGVNLVAVDAQQPQHVVDTDNVPLYD